ncbi:MAG: hypothetical protein KF774_03280 [Planctomyces sp.]|nr:hypothetical protein [Planctomyces sp.]
MPIETFRASSMREALAMVRQRWGADAIVLSSRETVRRRYPWSRPVAETEVTAAAGGESPANSEPRAARLGQQVRELNEHLHLPSLEGASAACESLIDDLIVPPDFATPAEREAADRHPADGGATLSDALFRTFTWLIDADIDEEHARALLFEAQSAGVFDEPLADAARRERLARLIESQLRCSGGLGLDVQRKKTIALVGPTGVGKTTTIAKLAAGFHLGDQRRIGLVTLDTFRAGAVDQLRTFADVIGLPMRTASTPGELTSALDDFQDRDLVLIDTAGRSPRDELRIQELRDLLSDASIDEVHLVLSLAASHRTLASMVERFRVLRPTHLLLTKLDEAVQLGAIYSAARTIDLPLSHFATGQDVPDDLEPAVPARTADMIMGLQDLESRTRPRLPSPDAAGVRESPG